MTIIIAHRGSSGTHPENTLPAFAEAVRAGVDCIKLDVHFTKDKQLVVIHDESVERITNGKGLVRDLTLTEIKELDAGSWFAPKYKATKISTLQEVLNLLLQMQYRGILNIELTDNYNYPQIEEAVSEVMLARDWPFTHWYSSFNLESLRIMHNIEPEAQLDLILKKSQSTAEAALTLDFIEGIHPCYDWVQENLELAKEYPKPIRPWSVNLYQSMIDCMNLKVDGLFTDFPEKAHRVRSRLKL